ncbi:hypothetical protein GCM10027516_04750 [Niabella aquatica]
MLVILLAGCTAFAQNTDHFLNSYINVKNALVNSDSKNASQAISILYQSVKDERSFELKDALLKATEKLSQASGIEKQRAAFNDVSTIMWKLVKSDNKAGQAVYYQYCPMKKAYWLSKEKEIRNPYYGSSMLTCGKVAETKS